MKEKKSLALLALVNINEFLGNLVTEVRLSLEISLPSWPFVGLAPLLWICILGCMCYSEPHFSSIVCADRRLTLVYCLQDLGILIIYWISAR